MFQSFDATRCAFPPARVPPLPDRPRLVLAQPVTTTAKASDRLAHFAHFAHFAHYARGRYALAATYRLAGVGGDGSLLAPSYHCVTMLDPALALGAQVALYPLHADLSPDLNVLDRVAAACTPPARALLATHYFGFVRDFSRLRGWCEARGIVLIEDCSHVLYTPTQQAPGTGIYGRYVVASPYKFFACEDGGLLHSPQAALPPAIAPRPARLVDELRGAKRQLERLRRRPPTVAEIGAIGDRLTAFEQDTPPSGDERTFERQQPSPLYRADVAQRGALRVSRTIVAHTAIDHLIATRRNNYRHWLQALAEMGSSGACRPLYDELPDGCAPYMLPLYLKHPTPYFARLKRLGVPLWRWDEMAVSDCAVAADYRLHLVHLPCHQSLSQAAMDWMIAAVCQTLALGAPGAG